MHTTSLLRIFRAWLISVTIIYLIAPTYTSLALRVVGVLLIFTLFLPVFFAKKLQVDAGIKERPLGYKIVLFFLVLQFFCAEYAINYYTGSGIVSTISDFIDGKNLYSSYQAYFKEENIAELSLGKIPAIIGLAATKSIFLYLFSSVFLGHESKTVSRMMLISVLPIVLVSLARGTFFEIFEILVVIVYGVSLHVKRFKARHALYALVIGLLFMGLFILNTLRRYEDAQSYFSGTCATFDYCFNPYGVSISFEYMIFVLSAYFSMGLFFLSSYISFLFDGELWASIFPFAATSFAGIMNDGLEREICRYFLDCRAVWMPELISWISFFGILMMYPILWYMLRFSGKLERRILSVGSRCSFPLLCLLLIYILSLPVGKFWTVSSQNIISTLIFMGAIIISKIRRKAA